MSGEIAQYADFSEIRYAQCWEDADVLLAALAVQPHHTCLSIASAGDNTLALLSRSPQRVIAVDLSPAQMACLELRVAAYRHLSHPELLVLLGSRLAVDEEDKRNYRDRPHDWLHHLETMAHTDPEDWMTPDVVATRYSLYKRCRADLSPAVRQFWDQRPQAIAHGIGNSGKLERYLTLFRRRILPLIHPWSRAIAFLQLDSPSARQQFYQQHWDTWRWRLVVRLFFSRFVLGRLGTDSSFLRYAQADLPGHLLQRIQHILTQQAPLTNPYLQWILLGHHATVLPYALRPENFAAIRANLDRLEWHCTALEDFVQTLAPDSIHSYNLSNVFEFMSPATYHRLLLDLRRAGCPGGRLVYWNQIVDRHRPPSFAHCLQPMTAIAQSLYQQDQVCFYRNLVIETMI